MHPRILKYVLDIESVISELESFKELVQNDFEPFQKQ